MKSKKSEFRSIVQYFWSHSDESNVWEVMNERIESYNRKKDNYFVYRIEAINSYKMKIFWRNMKIYVIQRLCDTDFWGAFQNSLLQNDSHLRFEYENSIATPTYYKYVSMGYRAVLDYLIWYRLIRI